jgi:MoxR-like ATPase
MHMPESIDATAQLLAQQNYVADRQLATAVFLALKLGRPLFLEGEPGTGKTEIAKVLAAGLGAELIRLQCYEGLDINAAAYEWNYARQMLEIRLAEAAQRIDFVGARGPSPARAEAAKRLDAVRARGPFPAQAEATHESRRDLSEDLFSERFLVERPLLRALLPHPRPPVLLIDELDRTDEPFEAYLLEVLSDFQITIPEWKTVRAERPPIVVITSNRTREIHDAVKRRCIYHWVDYPSAAREFEIVRRKAPEAKEALSRQIVAFVQSLRTMDLYKLPGVSETIEWTRALLALDAVVLEPETVNNTLGVLLKYQDDIARVQGSEAARLIEQVRQVVATSP